MSRITPIIAQWVPGSWAGNSKCPTPIQAGTVSRHNDLEQGNDDRHNEDAVDCMVTSEISRKPSCRWQTRATRKHA